MKIGQGILIRVDNNDIKGGTFTIPDSIKSIGEMAFEGCSGLKSITIPNGVKSIGFGAFSGCSGLKSITIPNSVTSIGDYAFYFCSGLKSITIPNSVMSIGVCAFWGCHGLTSKQANYKAFHIKGNKLLCRGKTYSEGERNSVQGNLKLCKNGIHYCANLFEIFNYYYGELDTDMAIYEIEVGGKVIKDQYSSKCCTNSCFLKKRLYRTDIIKILNGED